MARIRPYTADDLASVVLVFQRSVHEVAIRDYSPSQIAAWAPDPPDVAAWSKRLAGGSVFIAEEGQTIAGFVSANIPGHIDLLYVHPDFLSRGIAHSLCEHAVSWLCSHGASLLTAEVSLTARQFFERANFRVVRSQQVERHGVRLQNFLMERNVQPA